MDEARRLNYLKALGIDVYQRPQSSAAKNTSASACDTHQSLQHSTETSPSWDSLKQRVKQCQRCELANTRTQTVFGVGNPQADWFIIGEAPGADEDKQGEPFVGRAGQLLNEILWAADRPRETVYIANILKCRPPNNRDPRPEEVEQCQNYLKQQIRWTAPKLLLCVGRIAAQNVLNVDTPIGQLRGKVHSLEIDNQRIPVVVTYHPAYLLRSPKEKQKVWQDIQLACSIAAR